LAGSLLGFFVPDAQCYIARISTGVTCMKFIVGALAVAVLAGCMAPTMNEARQGGPYKVLTSKKFDSVLAKCVQYE